MLRVLACVVLLSIGVRVAPTAGSEIDLIIAAMERQESEIGAYEVKFRFDQRTKLGDRTQVARLEHRQCIDGSRRRLECTGHFDVALPMDREDSIRVVSEGRHNVLNKAARQGTVGEPAEFAPDYIAGAYLFTDGLLARFKADRDHINCVLDNIDGRQVQKCSWRIAEWGADIDVWLDPQRAYQPVKYLMATPFNPGAFPDGRERGVHRLIVSDYWQSGRAALPAKVQTTYEFVWPGGRREVVTDNTLTVTSVTTNKPFTSDEFTVTFPDGYLVTDVERQVYYVQGDPKSERRLGQPVDSTPVGPDGVRAERSSWGGWWLWVAGGLALFAVAGVLKYRAARE